MILKERCKLGPMSFSYSLLLIAATTKDGGSIRAVSDYMRISSLR
jgi:hypothetical protein